MAALLKALRAADFYRSTAKKDEDSWNFLGTAPAATLQGAVCTYCTLAVCALLFVLELQAYMAYTPVYDVVLNDNSVKDETMLINFNVSFPHLPCKFASVDITDVTHTRRLNVTKNVRKFFLGKSGRVVGEEQHHETEKEGAHETLPDDHPIHDRDADHSTALGEGNYDDFVKSHDVVLVNFFAPWCHWCRKLEPVWEHTASELKTKVYRNTVTFAKVDCVKEARLCQRHLVRAYPTILTYQQGKTDLHKIYRGARSTQAFLDYVEHLDRVASRIKAGTVSEDEIGTDVKKDPAGESEGCMVTGHINVKTVPGSLVVTAHSEWHNFEASAIDVSHAVNGFSFGSAALVDPFLFPHMSTLAGTTMDAFEEKRINHHHYLKIVETWFPGKKWLSFHGSMFPKIHRAFLYQYTTHSHSYVAPKEGVPQARFQFEIDPMAVKIGRKSTSIFNFLTSICAIIGGAFAVMGMAAGSLQRFTDVMCGRSKSRQASL